MKAIVTWPGWARARKHEKTATLLFGGDFCPIHRYEQKILASEKIFDEALEAAMRNSDFCMVNLEAPLCDPNLSRQGSGLRADPRIAGFIKRSGIDAVALANNHIRDFKDAGALQTMKNLEHYGVLHTGAGKNLAEAQKPLGLKVNGLKLGIWNLAEKELNVASDTVAGSSWFRPDRDVARIKELRAEFDFLVISVHAGHEFMLTPSPRIREAYRSLIEAGADAVIGHHPHVVQGVEKYKGGLIAYSLGNFVFDSPYFRGYDNTDLGYLVQLQIAKHRVARLEIIPYKLRKNFTVSSLSPSELAAFSKMFRAISANIIDDAKFYREWEKNVKFRWNTCYRSVLLNFSKNITDKKQNYAFRAKNLFACPTHVEILERGLIMIEEGKLPRL